MVHSINVFIVVILCLNCISIGSTYSVYSDYFQFCTISIGVFQIILLLYDFSWSDDNAHVCTSYVCIAIVSILHVMFHCTTQIHRYCEIAFSTFMTVFCHCNCVLRISTAWTLHINHLF